MNDVESKTPKASSGTSRLSIVHIMLWTAISAVYVSLLRWLYGMLPLSDEIAAMQRASGVVNAIIAGAEITGAVVLIHARVTGQRTQLLSQPGHWLLLIHGFFAVLSISIYTVCMFFLDDIPSSPYENLFVMFYGLSFVVMTVAFLFAAWRTQPFQWILTFLAISVLSALQGVTYLMWIPLGIELVSYTMMWVAYGRLAVSVWIIAIAAWDIAQSQRRDWLHWLGVAAYLLGMLVTFLQSLWQLLFR